MDENSNITFEDLPKALSWVIDKLIQLDMKIDNLTSTSQLPPAEQWMNLKELCEYLPSHPAEQTVYGWTSCHLIPFHKKGKRIMFLKSEINLWLRESKMKSSYELEKDAKQFYGIIKGLDIGSETAKKTVSKGASDRVE